MRVGGVTGCEADGHISTSAIGLQNVHVYVYVHM